MKMKTKAIVAGIMATVMVVGMLSLTGCSWFESKLNDIRGSLVGVGFNTTIFDNYGEKTGSFTADKVSLKGNYIEELSYGDDGITRHKTLSSVVTINMDGHEMETCGDTVIFAEKGLEPDLDFYEITYGDGTGTVDIVSRDDGDFLDNTAFAYLINRYENVFGKKRVVVIKSQMGRPLCAYSGDNIYYEVKEELPKTTKLMVDGKALYIHRANFQIIDTALL